MLERNILAINFKFLFCPLWRDFVTKLGLRWLYKNWCMWYDMLVYSNQLKISKGLIIQFFRFQVCQLNWLAFGINIHIFKVLYFASFVLMLQRCKSKFKMIKFKISKFFHQNAHCNFPSEILSNLHQIVQIKKLF